MHPAFRHNQYRIRRHILTLVGAKLEVFGPSEELLMFIRMKAFKLKEDITIFADREETTPLLRIRARNIIDFSATYDVFDVSHGSQYKVGALRRKGLKSIIQDSWLILGQSDEQVGEIQEDSGALAILRRIVDLFALIVPQKFKFSIKGHPVGTMEQNRNPFVMKMTADFSADPQGYFDRRLAAASAVLLCVIEGKQK
ncbi:hypothetical protein GC173_10060 [bacterium]|nr:hypothetical protein [bacterium]